jgi:hypothetical protein
LGFFWILTRLLSAGSGDGRFIPTIWRKKKKVNTHLRGSVFVCTDISTRILQQCTEYDWNSSDTNPSLRKHLDFAQQNNLHVPYISLTAACSTQSVMRVGADSANTVRLHSDD